MTIFFNNRIHTSRSQLENSFILFIFLNWFSIKIWDTKTATKVLKYCIHNCIKVVLSIQYSNGALVSSWEYFENTFVFIFRNMIFHNFTGGFRLHAWKLNRNVMFKDKKPFFKPYILIIIQQSIVFINLCVEVSFIFHELFGILNKLWCTKEIMLTRLWNTA